MKKWIAWLLMLVLVLTMASCGETIPGAESVPTTETPEAEQSTSVATVPTTETVVDTVKETIYVLVPNRNTHAEERTMSKAAQDKADAVNAEGRCTVIVQSCADGNEMREQLREIAANATKDGTVGVIILMSPWSQWVSYDQLDGLEIPYIVAGQPNFWTESPFMISNIVYDEETIGAAAASYLVANGMKEGDKVLVFEDGSSLDAYSSEGFVKYLQGEISFNGKKIQTPWTSLDSIFYSRPEVGVPYSVSQGLKDYLCDPGNAETKYIATWNDGTVSQFLIALRTEGISADSRGAFLRGKPYITGGGASIFKVLDGNHVEYGDVAQHFGGIMSVTYSPELIETAIQTMADYFDGKEVGYYIELPIDSYLDMGSVYGDMGAS